MDGCPITYRQREILQSLANGQTRSQIARRLHIGLERVHAQTYAARRALAVRDDLQAVLKAARDGWILLDGLEATGAIQIPSGCRSLLDQFPRDRIGAPGSERDWVHDLMLDMAESASFPPL